MTVVVGDVLAATNFYDAVLSRLGMIRLVDYEDPEDEDEAGVEAVGYGVDAGASAALWLVKGLRPTTGLHLAFRAPDAAAVDGIHAAGLASGGVSVRAPRGWQIYRPGRYAAVLADPGGNLVEAFVDFDGR